jgi:hypothetical protein
MFILPYIDTKLRRTFDMESSVSSVALNDDGSKLVASLEVGNNLLAL